MPTLLDEITKMCDDNLLFREVLEDILYNNKIAKGVFANGMHWKPQVVSRLASGEFPNWMTLGVVKQMAHCAACTPAQEAQLIEAFICDLMRKHDVVAKG